MNRIQFVALTASAVGVVGLVASIDACSSGSVAGADAGGDAGLVRDDAAALGHDLDTLGLDCINNELNAMGSWPGQPTPLPPEAQHQVTPNLIAAARQSYAAGATTILLSPSGCTRLIVERSAGKVVRETLVRAPFAMTVDVTSLHTRPLPASITQWTYSDAGHTFLGDYDSDGFAEVRGEIVTDVSSKVQEFAPAGDTVVARETATVVSAGGGVTTVVEAMVNGALTVVRDNTAASLQQACGPKGHLRRRSSSPSRTATYATAAPPSERPLTRRSSTRCRRIGIASLPLGSDPMRIGF